MNSSIKDLKVLDLVYSQKLHHIVEQEPVVKYKRTYNKTSAMSPKKVFLQFEDIGSLL